LEKQDIIYLFSEISLDRYSIVIAFVIALVIAIVVYITF